MNSGIRTLLFSAPEQIEEEEDLGIDEKKADSYSFDEPCLE